MFKMYFIATWKCVLLGNYHDQLILKISSLGNFFCHLVVAFTRLLAQTWLNYLLVFISRTRFGPVKIDFGESWTSLAFVIFLNFFLILYPKYIRFTFPSAINPLHLLLSVHFCLVMRVFIISRRTNCSCSNFLLPVTGADPLIEKHV